jgi:septin family protein
MGYSEKQRNLVLMKVLPQNNRAVHEVSKDSGVAVQTMYKWLNMVKDGTLTVGSVDETPPVFKTDIEKFSLILESKALGDEQLGEWLRRNGLRTEYLSLWEQELAGKMTAQEQNYKEEAKNLRKELQQTKRELHKKEKALAERAALYTLKKKAEEIWGANEDD